MADLTETDKQVFEAIGKRAIAQNRNQIGVESVVDDLGEQQLDKETVVQSCDLLEEQRLIKAFRFGPAGMVRVELTLHGKEIYATDYYTDYQAMVVAVAKEAAPNKTGDDVAKATGYPPFLVDNLIERWAEQNKVRATLRSGGWLIHSVGESVRRLAESQ
jgi:hypothetical protein